MKKILIASALIALCTVFAGCGGKNGNASSSTTIDRSTTVTSHPTTTESFSEKLNDVMETVSEKISDAGEKVSEKISDANENLSEGLSDAGETLKSDITDLSEALSR